MDIQLSFSMPSFVQLEKTIDKEVRAQLYREKYLLRKMFEQTTLTWEHEKPSFEVQSTLIDGNFIVTGGVSTSSDTIGAMKWEKLNEGFYRQVFMNDDYVPKTVPGVLKARHGKNTGIRGNSIYPIPVEARGWIELIEDGMEGKLTTEQRELNPRGIGRSFYQRIQRAIERGMKKRGLI